MGKYNVPTAAVLLLVEASAAATRLGALSNLTVAVDTVFDALAANVRVVVPAPEEFVVTRSSFFPDTGGTYGTQSGTLDGEMFAVIMGPKSSNEFCKGSPEMVTPNVELCGIEMPISAMEPALRP